LRLTTGSNSVDSHTHKNNKHWHWAKHDTFQANSCNKLL